VLEKCFWYTIKFHLSNNKWTYMNQEQLPAKLMVQEETGKQVPIPRHEPSKVCRTLGVQLAPDGNNKEEAKYLTQVTSEWGGGKIVKGRLTHVASDYCL